MADPYHQNLERQLRATRDRVRQSFDKPNDPMARLIHNELQKAEDMAQTGQNLRSIEDRLKAAQRSLQQSQNTREQDRIIDPHHAESHFDVLDDIRNDIRRHPRY